MKRRWNEDETIKHSHPSKKAKSIIFTRDDAIPQNTNVLKDTFSKFCSIFGRRKSRSIAIQTNGTITQFNTTKEEDYQPLSTINCHNLLKQPNTKCINSFLSHNMNNNSSVIDVVSLCKEDAKKEIVPILIRRVVMPFYIPVITLLCSFLLFRNKNLYFNKASVFCYAFSLLLFTELIIRYTGLNDLLGWIYLILPFSLIAIFYFFLNSKFSSEAKLQ